MFNRFQAFTQQNVCTGEYDSLEAARATVPLVTEMAYIEERDKEGGFVMAHSFYPPPQPTPPRPGIVDDITESAAWDFSTQKIKKTIQQQTLSSLVGRALSQPQEYVLEDYCEGVANTVFKENINLWAAVLPQTDSPQANLCIVNELEGLARAELRRALVALRGSLDDAVSICDRME